MAIIKGHFWVVRDGKIIDPYFPLYDEIKKEHKLTGNRIYKLASKQRRREMKKEFITPKMEWITEWKNDDHPNRPLNWEKCLNDFPEARSCAFNAVMEKILRGGQICYGDMGWKRINDVYNEGVFWEYDDRHICIDETTGHMVDLPENTSMDIVVPLMKMWKKNEAQTRALIRIGMERLGHL